MSEKLSVIQEDKRPERRSTSELGVRGESLAAEYLKERGYRLVLANFRVPVGRNSRGVQITGEIDLIALDGNVLCFIEVKTRRSADFTPILTAVDLRKQRQITRTSRVYRNIFGVSAMDYRYDVISVLMLKAEEPVIELVKGFWHEGKFRKRAWSHQQDFV
ncbi:MAG: YraN family protein [Blastocatellia bacterium]